MEQHFVTFYSPGTFVSEETTRPIDKWDTDHAVTMAHEITERHGATPFGFQFTTRSRSESDLDSKVTSESPMYYLGGTIRTLEEVISENKPDESILRSNMETNDIKRIITNNNSWRHTSVLNDNDIVLDFVPRRRA